MMVANAPLRLDDARRLDMDDPLRGFRTKFFIPQPQGEPLVYLTGNSLGLQPVKAREYAEQEFHDWATLGVEGHFHSRHPWYYYHHFCEEQLAHVVGAKTVEVTAMGSLTNNLHLLMVSFYRPTKARYKILVEASAFPSDQYAVQSQAKFHGFDPNDAIVEARPRDGEYTLRTEDIVALIEQHKDSLALVMFGGVNYLTGQCFDMETITAEAHKHGAVAGFDLAHAAGNVLLQLHDWNVDFACWCSYKYLNSGPGGVAGIFVHERHSQNDALPRFAGWWGTPEDTRFKMTNTFQPQAGAAAWQLSNAPVLPLAVHRASLELFQLAGMPYLREKSRKLTYVMQNVIDEYNAANPDTPMDVITPHEFSERGCQFSVVAREGKTLFNKLSERGVVVDWREPNVMRMAPVPLYNSFEDIYRLKEALMAKR
jgi:kynureninase